ncbi:MAG: hypothetical protein WCK51_00245 [Armatimonadota bacterium]
MAKQPKRKVLTTILAIFGLVLFLLAIVGATYGRGFMAIVGRDKDFIRTELIAAHQDRKGSPEIQLHSQKLEKSLGKFQEITNIMGMADMGDMTSGKNEFSYYAYCQFEKGEGTYIIRVSNENEQPKLLSVTSEPRHIQRKRVRQELLNQLR